MSFSLTGEHCNLRVFCQFLQLDMRAYADVHPAPIVNDLMVVIHIKLGSRSTGLTCV